MIQRLGELERLLANMIKPGKIVAAQYGKPPRVRVQIGGCTTAWLPWAGGRAGGDRSWFPPEVGEQVIVLSVCGDHTQGFVIPGVYQDSATAPGDSPDKPRIVFKDGAVIEYDRAASVLTVTLPDGGKSTVTTGAANVTQTKDSIKASIGGNSAEVKADSVTLTAGGTTLAVKDGSITMTLGACTITFDASGATVSGGDVKAGAISLTNHIHPGVQSGGASTGPAEG